MSKFRFDLKANAARSRLNAMAIRIGNIAVAHVKNEVFPSESWDGKKWARRKDAPWKKADRGHPLLQKTDKMKNSVHVIRANSKGVKWGAGVGYSIFHNKGTSKMPKRQFIGMDRRLAGLIKKEVSLTFKNLLKK